MKSTSRATSTTVLYDIPRKTYGGFLRALPEHHMRHTYQDGTLKLSSNLIRDVPWASYEKILKAFGDKRFHHTYQDGTLEILVSPSEDHERIKRLLGRMIETMSLEINIPIDSVGSATRKHKKLAQGLEPDESYYINPTAKPVVQSKTPVPDLAVEVDMRRSQLRRMESYAKLGIREVWRYRKGQVEFFALVNQLEYEQIQRSTVLPLFTTEIVNRFVQEMRDSSEHVAILGFIRWLRKQSRKS